MIRLVAKLIEDNTPVLDSLFVDREAVTPVGFKDTIRVWEDASLPGIKLEEREVFVTPSGKEDIAARRDMDIARVLQADGEVDWEEFIDGLVGFELGDHNLAQRTGYPASRRTRVAVPPMTAVSLGARSS